MSSTPGDTLSDAKRRLIERLRLTDTATAPELAAEFGLTDTAVRQHLEALEHAGLVARRPVASSGPGRPPTHWHLTPAADTYFPDRHSELTVELLVAVRDAFGEAGLDAVVAARTERQRAAYRATIGDPASLPVAVRVERLAALRTAEGYLAEVRTDPSGEVVLIEHHCPICSAAEACAGLCRGELELFSEVLGSDVSVERTAHRLADGTRCMYCITAHA